LGATPPRPKVSLTVSTRRSRAAGLKKGADFDNDLASQVKKRGRRDEEGLTDLIEEIKTGVDCRPFLELSLAKKGLASADRVRKGGAGKGCDTTLLGGGGDDSRRVQTQGKESPRVTQSHAEKKGRRGPQVPNRVFERRGGNNNTSPGRGVVEEGETLLRGSVLG